jgi:Uma2 family endonuclease
MSVKQLVTVEDLWEMPEKPGVRFELVEGELVEVPGAGARQGLIAGLVCTLVHAFVRPRNLGIVLGDGVGYILGRAPDRLRIPDVSFVSRARIPEDGVPEGFWPMAPDLAVEVVSPNDRANDVQDKIGQYLAGGTRLVWVLWPRRRSVSVHAGHGLVRELGPEEELDGGEVLPGFRARVAELFNVDTSL